MKITIKELESLLTRIEYGDISREDVESILASIIQELKDYESTA